MSKIPVLKPKEVLRILKRAGFEEIRSKGSHVHLKKEEKLVYRSNAQSRFKN